MSEEFDSKSADTVPTNKNMDLETIDKFRDFSEHQISHVQELVKIGLALSAEKNLDRLLEMIVSEARRFTYADGATLYIKREKEGLLDFAIIQNDTLNIRMGGTGKSISWNPISLSNPDGSLNYRNVSAYCSLVGEVVNIPDVYNAEGFDFQGTKDFDKTTGYRAKSMLVIPMRNHESEVIGVLQLLNARNYETGEVAEFPANEIEIITSLSSQAAIAITNMRLIKGLEDLLNSFVQSIADAIDEKSPYTAGHILRVAGLTDRIAKKLNECSTGKFSDVTFSQEELAEIRMMAWMHDIGKISTPEHVVDKSTKLEAICDRIELITHRIEILKRDLVIEQLKQRLGDEVSEIISDHSLQEKLDKLDEHLEFLKNVNHGGEYLTIEKMKKIEILSSLYFELEGNTTPLLNIDEVENLTISNGTLTARERRIIKNHVNTTIKMLEGLPFPKKLKNVPLFAGMHHEKLDGSGYPKGLTASEIPLQARILAIADIFEALTATDRPYKKGKRMSESMRILADMTKQNHLDSDLCDFVVESGLIAEYARNALPLKQLDDFEWKGKLYIIAEQSESADSILQEMN